jgi:hypothetical protein
MYNPEYNTIIQTLMMDDHPNGLGIVLGKERSFPNKTDDEIIELIINFIKYYKIVETYLETNIQSHFDCKIIERVQHLVYLLLGYEKSDNYYIICFILRKINVCIIAYSFKYDNERYIILNNDINNVYWDCQREDEEYPTQWIPLQNYENKKLDDNLINFINNKEYIK